MKEKIVNQGSAHSELTTQPPKGYSMGGDISMAEPGQGEKPPQRPMNVNEATHRLEEAARRRGQQSSSAEASGGGAGRREPPPGPHPEQNPPSDGGGDFIDINTIRDDQARAIAQKLNSLRGRFLSERSLERLYNETLDMSSSVSREDRERVMDALAKVAQRLYDAQEDPLQIAALKGIKAINEGGGDVGEKEKRVIQELRKLSPSEGMGTQLIDSIVNYDGALEYLVNRIISEPLDTETGRYQLSFYGGINLSLIKERIKSKYEELERKAEDPENIDRNQDLKNSLMKKSLSEKLDYMKEGAEYAHTMNSKVVTGDNEQFLSVAREFQIIHLQVLQQSPLVSAVMRLYEGELKRVGARDGKITTANYAEITGTILDEKGKVVAKREGTVFELLQDLNRELPEEERLEGWQLRWAFYSGRNLLNSTLRAAELIAQSKEIGYKSYPQESASRIIDPLNLTGQRFGIAEQRGGLQLYEMTEKIFSDNRTNFGWEKSNIKTLMGGDRRQFEARGIFEITGVWSGWRQNSIIQIPDPDKPTEKSISLQDFLDKNWSPTSTSNDLIRIYLKNGELKEEFYHSLGVIMRLGNVMPSEKDKPDMLKAKREVRAAIWRKVAKDNPLAMVDFLRGMRFEEGKEPEPNINTELENLDRLLFNEKTDIDKEGKIWKGGKTKKWLLTGKYTETETWKSLRKKLTIAHEERMKRIRDKNYTQLDTFDISELTGDEKKILDAIRKLGLTVAGDMADIRFPTDPFMNDVLFEDANYGEAGAEFLRRRLGGDIPSMYKAGGAFIQMMDNPGGIPIEEALKTFHEMERALESPQGQEAGQNNISAVLEAYLTFIKAGGNAEDTPGLLNFLTNEGEILNDIKKRKRTPNSWAQVFAGPQAPSLTSASISPILDKILLDGVLRRGKGVGGAVWTDLYDRFRKKFKTKPLLLLLRYLFDMTPIFLIGSMADVGQKSAKTDQ